MQLELLPLIRTHYGLLLRLYDTWMIGGCREYFDKIISLSLATMDFVREAYGVLAAQLEFYPIGGRVFVYAEYSARRVRGRRDAAVGKDAVLLLQTGKMGRRKKVPECLNYFNQTPGKNLHLMLAGSLDEDLRGEAEVLIGSDSRTAFRGWRQAEALSDLLCAASVYVQPGTQSVNMQMPLCARCSVIIDDVRSHVPYFERDGWRLAGHNGSRLLDYRELAKRLQK